MIERKILTPPLETNRFTTSGSCLLLRHGEDKTTLSTELNQPLDGEKIHAIHDFASEAKKFYQIEAKKHNWSGVVIIHGPKIRTTETAEICAAVISNNGIPVSIQEEPLLGEMQQGKFIVNPNIINPDLSYPPLQIAWKVFRNEMSEGNLDYRFGDPSRATNEEERKMLEKYFQAFGECQREITWRVYKFLNGLKSTDSSKMHLVVTHQVVISKIQRTASAMANQYYHNNTQEVGVFSKHIEQTGGRTDVLPANAVAISLGCLRWAGEKLKSELIYLTHQK